MDHLDFSSRCIGAVLGAAIGDALGHPTEFLSWEGIKQRYGPQGVTDYVLFWEEDGVSFAPFTDDTQMAEQVFRSLATSQRKGMNLDETMQHLAKSFIEWSLHPRGGHRSPGKACLAGCQALLAGKEWFESGGETAGGCGSVMRAYPFGLYFTHAPEIAEEWAVAHSKLTHRDPIALAACAAMAVGVAWFAQNKPFEFVVEQMCSSAKSYSPVTEQMMKLAYQEAKSGIVPRQTLDRLRGWAAHEAIAAAVYIIARHPNNLRRALLEAINTPGDSDSLGTLVGALLGARLGAQALPEAWILRLERQAELINMAREGLLDHQV